MTLNEYQQHALETAIYPENRRIIYPTLGLTGEAGEVFPAPAGPSTAILKWFI